MVSAGVAFKANSDSASGIEEHVMRHVSSAADQPAMEWGKTQMFFEELAGGRMIRADGDGLRQSLPDPGGYY